jgi:hypothetical protein
MHLSHWLPLLWVAVTLRVTITISRKNNERDPTKATWSGPSAQNASDFRIGKPKTDQGAAVDAVVLSYAFPRRRAGITTFAAIGSPRQNGRGLQEERHVELGWCLETGGGACIR